MMEQSQKIAALIYKHLQGELSVQEKKELDEWMAASEENALLFKRLTHKEIYAEAEKDFDDARLVTAAHRLSRRVGFEVRPYVQGRSKTKQRYMRWVKYAAAIVAVLIAGLWIYKYNTGKPSAEKQIAQQAPPVPIGGERGKAIPGRREVENILAAPREHIVTTRRGEKHVLQLPDGSKVWLNADSKLRYPAAFAGHERKVYLYGEAYFEIAPDKSMPFVAAAPDGTTVEVLGTHFNVRSYKAEKESRVSLLEGGVRVSKGNAVRILKPLEQAIVAADGRIDKMPVDPLAAIGWKNGVLYFEDADIDRFTAEISRAYDIDIHHSGYLKWFHYRGPVPTTLTIDGLLQELSKPELKLDARLTGRTITIKPK